MLENVRALNTSCVFYADGLGTVMSLKGVYTGGYVVLGAATASTVYLTFF